MTPRTLRLELTVLHGFHPRLLYHDIVDHVDIDIYCESFVILYRPAGYSSACSSVNRAPQIPATVLGTVKPSQHHVLSHLAFERRTVRGITAISGLLGDHIATGTQAAPQLKYFS